MAFRYIKRVVEEFQEPNTATAKLHEKDLKYTSIRLFNTIVDGLRAGGVPPLVNIVLDTSKIINETTMMRSMIAQDEASYRRALEDWHLTGGCYRIPTKIATFHQLRKKRSCKVKDCVIEMVTKLYRIHSTTKNT